MTKLPRDVSSAQFEGVLRKLGYSLHTEGPGAKVTYVHAEKMPFTFHRAHHPKVFRAGTLRAMIRKLGISVEEFVHLLS